MKEEKDNDEVLKKELKKAYRILSDPVKKTFYDLHDEQFLELPEEAIEMLA